MSQVVLARIDDRLIHGQVIIKWIESVDPTEILIIDAGLCHDDFLLQIFKSMIPDGVSLRIMDEKSAIAYLLERSEERKVLLLTRSPLTFLTLQQSGISFPEVNIGCMGHMPQRGHFYKSLYATEAEIAAIRHLQKSGTKFIYRPFPRDVGETLL